MGAIAAAIAVGSIGAALFFGLAIDRTRRREADMTLLTVSPSPMPPRVRPVHLLQQKKAAKAPGSPNLRNKATDVVAPPPIIQPPVAIPIVAAPRADVGAVRASGASDISGAGIGAGGNGNGEGGGGSSDGDGGETPPRLRRGLLKFALLPEALRAAGVEGRVGVSYSVETDGRVGDCLITDTSGNAALDAATCELIRRHYLYYPSRDAAGRPVRSTIVGSESWIINRSPDLPPHPGKD